MYVYTDIDIDITLHGRVERVRDHHMSIHLFPTICVCNTVLIASDPREG